MFNRNPKAVLGLLIAFHTLLGCAHHSPSSLTAPEPAAVLTQIEAAVRAKQISQIRYHLHFDFTSSPDQFLGHEVIEFESLTSGRDLRLDFSGGEISNVRLNERPIQIERRSHFAVIKGVDLKKGPQKLELDFRHEYSRQGEGLSRFVDPVDQAIYLTSQFEVFSANRAFPCFDQPDLKATFALTVQAPEPWEVITSVRESQKEKIETGVQLWTFPTSARFSTYVFSLHAGPFAKWEDRSFRIPLRLFARRSMAQDVHPDEWFPITRHGFDFFEPYFGTPYPYKKYDQLIVPEFNWGAMENVAAVTFSEGFTRRGAKSRQQLRSLSNVILHEMAHMWFGNLVTMKWWGDLWLNESFATYMSSVAMAASPLFAETWHQFFQAKTGAYREDENRTTHPIVARVDSTAVALTTVDGITYGKGAAVLKQLSHLLGEEKFKKGLQIYFERHANQNAESRDFLRAMSEASERDLQIWQKDWFETAGLNALNVKFECREGRISQLAIIQTVVNGDSISRSHSVELALLSRANGIVRVNDQIQVEVSQPTTYVPSAIGKACPHLAYPNFNDFGYFKVKLDEKSTQALQYSLNEIENPMLRHQFWSALWDQVREAEFNFATYGDLLVSETIAKEQDELVLRQLIQNANRVLSYYSLSPRLKETEGRVFRERLDQQVMLRLKSAKAQSLDQLTWFDALISLASTPQGLQFVKQLLKGQVTLTGFRLDQDRRWNLIQVLSRHQDPEALKMIDAEAKRDKTSEGVQQKIASLALQPNWQEKSTWIEEFKSQKSNYSFSQLRSALLNLFPSNQSELRNQYADSFFKDLMLVNSSQDDLKASLFTVLSPNECDEKMVGRTAQFLKDAHNLKPVVLKNLNSGAQEAQRCLKVIQFAEKGSSPMAQ